MSIRRRNKIKLPTTSTNFDDQVNDNNDVPKIKIKAKIKLKPTLDIEDDYDDTANQQDDYNTERSGLPIKIKSLKIKKKIDKSFENTEDNLKPYQNKNETENTSSVSAYSDLKFKKISEINVLNLEDMEDMEDMEDIKEIYVPSNGNKDNGTSYYLPNLEEIKSIKEERAMRRQLPNSSENFKEKDYLKLLDNDDKLEILENIKNTGGVKKSNEKDTEWGSHEFNVEEFDDARLALTDNERVKQSIERKEQIKKAIERNSKYDSQENEDWEIRALKNSANIKEVESVPSLPILFKSTGSETFSEDPEDSLDDILSDLIRKTKLENSKISLQYSALENQSSILHTATGQLLIELAEF